jgi:ATP-binding cassette, subfamily B, bacterial PglK
MQYLHRFLYLSQGKYKSLLLMILLFLLVSCLEMVGIGLIGPFISLAMNPVSAKQNKWLDLLKQLFDLNSDNQLLLLVGALVIAVFYLKSFLNFNVQKYIFEFGFNQQGELAAKLMHSYLAAPYTFHLNRNSANLIQNIINETERFSNGFMMPLLTCVSNTVVILALVSLLIATDLMAVVIIGGIVLISAILFYRFKDRIGLWGQETSESRTEMIRLINHSLGGLKETKIIGCEAYFEDQMQTQIRKFATSVSSALIFSNLPRYVVEAFLITFLIGFTLLFITINRGNTQNLSSVLGIFAIASIRLLPAAANLISGINGIKYNAHSVDKLYLDLKELETIKAPGNLSSKSNNNDQVNIRNGDRFTIPFVNRITLENVSYAYPNTAKNSLTKVSLAIEKGRSIGLIGKSGAGKTTLVDVILGLLIPQQGDIKVDDVSIYNDISFWRNLIGYVPQSIFLIDDSLEKNIAFGVTDELIDHERLYKAIAAAQLNELVESLPQGLQTMVGERGVMLSGGQRQRVGIARALYHEREVLVFDEATAALDNETESLVTEAIKSLSGKKTMIIIAHRLSTIEHCDRIYLMENGGVIAEGSYQEVVLNQKNQK